MELPACPVETTLMLIGDKWKVLILRDLMSGTKRFGELKKSIGHVTQKVLTAQLRDMEAKGLLTRKVCEAFVRRGFDIPDLPQEVWTEDFVAYCLEHGPSFEWIRQTPRHLITWEIGTRVYKEHPDLVGYLPRRYLTPERTRKLYRQMPSLKDELPRHHFTEFSKQTGLSEEFYGGEVSLAELKRDRREFSYCRIGNTYLGLYRTGRYSSADTLLIMTRAAKSYIPAGPVFCHRIGTFHKTWLEKTVADRDPQFRKPKVPAALKDVQALCYYDVEPVRTVFGTTFYRNTFMGQTVGYLSLIHI